MVDAKGFKLALDDFAKQVNEKGAEFARQVALQAFTGCVMSSPVGNNTRWARNVERAANGKPPLPKGYVGGHFRKNWRLAVNSKPSGVVDGVDNSGQGAIDTAVAALLAGTGQGIATLREIWITNNLPYAELLENGWSKQAPQGMVGPTVAAIRSRFAGGSQR